MNMKIKHYAGYGTVNARRIKDCSMFTLHIRVEGNHECGVVREDEYDIYHWLVSRFDKLAPSYAEWHSRHPIIEVKPGWRTDPVLGVVDTCDYYITA